MGGENREVNFIIRGKDQASAVFKQVENSAKGTFEKLVGLKSILGAMSGALVGFSAVAIVKDILDLGAASNKAMSQIAASLPTGIEGMRELKHEIRETAIVSGRSLEEMQQAAVQIAHLGVTSAQEVSQRLRTATEVADATGADIKGIIGGMDQVMDLFGLSAEQAEVQFAKLVSAAKGRVDIEALFDAFQSTAEPLAKLGVNADTATRALVTLLDKGQNTRAIKSFIGEASLADIQKLASEARISSTALQDLRRDADLVRASVANTAQGLKTQFNAALEELGTSLGPLVIGTLKTMTFWMNAFTGRIDNNRIEQFIAHVKSIGALSIGGHLGSMNPNGPEGVGLGDALHGLNAAARGGYLDTSAISAQDAIKIRQAIEVNLRLIQESNKAIPLTAERVAELRKQYASLYQVLDMIDRRPAAAGGGGNKPSGLVSEADRQKVEDLRRKMDELAATTEQGKTKSQQFAAAMAAIEVEARKTTMSAGELKTRMDGLRDTLNKLKEEEAAEAFRTIDEIITGLSDNALVKFDAKFKETFRNLAIERRKVEASGDSAKLKAFDAGVDSLRNKVNALRAALVDTVDADDALKEWQTFLDHDPGNLAKSIAVIEMASAKLDDFKKKAAAATDADAAKKYREEMEKVDAFLQRLLGATGQGLFALPTKTEEAKKHAAGLAAAWGTVGRTIIAATQALGEMDDKTAATLQNMVSLGEGIARMFAGDLKGGGAEAGASLASLLGGLFKKGPSQEQIDARNLSVERLFTGILQQLDGKDSVGNRITNERQRFADARLQVERDLAGKANEAQREAKLRELNQLEAQRIQQLTDEYVLEQKMAQEDYEVRRLRAAGHADEADAMAFALEQQREYDKQIKAGANATTLAALAAAQLAEGQQRAADAAHEAAKKHLDAAVTRAGQALGIDDITDPTQVFGAKAKAYQGAGGALGKLFEGLDLGSLTADQIADLDKQLRELFHQLQESPESVDLAGLSIDDLIAALMDLDGAADAVAATVKSAADIISAAESQLAQDFDVFGTDAAGQFSEYAKTYGVDVGGFDLTSQKGVDEAIAYFQDQYRNATDDLAKHEFQQLIRSLRGIKFDDPAVAAALGLGGGAADGSLSAVASQFRGLSSEDGLRLADINMRQLHVLEDIRDGRVLSIRNPAYQPISFASTAQAVFGGGPGGTGGPTTLNIGPVHINAGATDDPEQLANGFIRALQVRLGRDVIVQQSYNGRISVRLGQ